MLFLNKSHNCCWFKGLGDVVFIVSKFVMDLCSEDVRQHFAFGDIITTEDK